MIELRDIVKKYGDLCVVDHVSLQIEKGEVVAIVGPSGAGKTTLLQIAGTLDKADSGTVIYDGVDVISLKDKELSRFRNRNIGFVFQFHQLLPEFTACENVALPAMIGGMNRKKAMTRAAELLDMLGLSERIRHKPGQMSGGEKQRAAIARSLINDPMVVLADEPTGALDSANRDEIQRIIKSLSESLQQTFIVVTHDPTLAAGAGRVISMRDGRIV